MTRTILAALALALLTSPNLRADNAVDTALAAARSKVVKLHGAGGAKGLEAYQSGVLVATEGQILTVASHVLSGDIIVTFDDGTRAQARLVAQDPARDLALLTIESGSPPGFDLAQPPPAARVGMPILALSNLFDIAAGNEPVSAQAGFVAGIAPLAARQGAFAAAVPGEVLYLDCVTNNPGAAGGAIVDLEGRLVGLIGKELTAESTDMFVNYAIPVAQLVEAYTALRGGPTADDSADAKVREPHRLDALGLTLVPDVLLSTPPYVDAVEANTSAARAGLRPDDLIVEVAGHSVRSCRELRERLRGVDRIDAVKLRVLREGKLLDLELPPPEAKP